MKDKEEELAKAVKSNYCYSFYNFFSTSVKNYLKILTEPVNISFFPLTKVTTACQI